MSDVMPPLPDRRLRGQIARNRRRLQFWALVLLAVADALLWAALG
ncbi:MAG TPA: hypothetical protein VKJ00_07560 [Thermoanaerobaculia bacterium]|nr:hypothetical protein [Thermoanaerobaculia bacterium]